MLVWICWFPLPLGVWEGLRFVIWALPGIFSYLSFAYEETQSNRVSEFRDSVCSLFAKAILFLLLFYTDSKY